MISKKLINKYWSYFNNNDPQHGLTMTAVFQCSDWVKNLSNEDIKTLRSEMFENIADFNEKKILNLIFVVNEINSNELMPVIKKYIELSNVDEFSVVKRYAKNLLDID